MNLNAGLIFIPEEAMVDRKTGSRYELDEGRHPIKNSEYQSVFRKVIDSADFQNLADQVIEITSKLSASMEWKDPNLLPKDQEILKKLEPFREKLEQEFNITDQRLQFAIT